MSKHQLRVQETLQYFTQKDIGLALRKLLDCAADTQQISIYGKATALTDRKEKHPTGVETLIEKATVLLREIADCRVTELPTEMAVLVTEEVRKHYALGHFQLGPISLSIKRGQVHGLVGENGSGKTTLLRILARDLSYDSGVVKYYFIKRSRNDYDLRTKLIYIPQYTGKWYGSLKDNLKFTLSSYGIPAEENELCILLMIARLGLWQYQHSDWNALSPGYKMRFELACILLRQPEILLLDESLGNLDVLAQQAILEDLKMIANSVNHPTTLILSLQQLFEVEKISDKVIFSCNSQYTDNAKATAIEEAMPLIAEIDTTNTREELIAAFKAFAPEKFNYNGGVYVVYFRPNTRYLVVLEALGEARIDLIYIRDISASTRRFFVSQVWGEL